MREKPRVSCWSTTAIPKDRRRHDDGWYHTGDTAWRDEEGYLGTWAATTTSSSRAAIASAPLRSRSVLLEHEAVRECAVTGVPDPVRGKAVKATVVLRKVSRVPKSWCASCRPGSSSAPRPTNIPRIVEFVDALPKTVNGKIRRAAIRESGRGTPKEKRPGAWCMMERVRCKTVKIMTVITGHYGVGKTNPDASTWP